MTLTDCNRCAPVCGARHVVGRIVLAGAAGLLALGANMASAQAPAPAPLQSQAEIENYCVNIVDGARERRYAIQREQLHALRAEIDERIIVLEERRQAFEDWLARREAFAMAANEGLVRVYGAMRPDAAARGMEELPADLSAALLTKLKPRVSAAILNEMTTERAATVTKIMAAVADSSLPVEK